MQPTIRSGGAKRPLACALALAALLAVTASIQSCKSKTEEERLAEASKALDERNVIGAELMLKEFLEKFPDSPNAMKARFGLSQAYFIDRAYDKCRATLDEIIKMTGGVDNQTGLNAAMLKLDTYLMEERLDVALNEAVQTSASLKTVGPEFRQFLNLKTAKLFNSNNKPEDALAVCRALLREKASPAIHFDSLEIMDGIFRAGKRADEFVAEYKGFIERFPESELALVAIVKLAQALQAEGRKDEAAAYFSQADAKLRESLAKTVGADQKIQISIQIAQLLEMQSKTAEAQEVLHKVIEEYPMSEQRPIVMRMLAESFFRAGNREEGKKMLDAIIQAYPNTPHSLEAARGKQEIAAAEAKEKDGATTGTLDAATPPPETTAPADAAAPADPAPAEAESAPAQ